MVDSTAPDKLDKNQKLQSTTEGGHPPEHRIANAKAAHNIFKKVKEDSKYAAIHRAKIKGQLDGNAPYDDADRKRLGLSWLSNVNFGESRANIRSNATALHNMFNSVDALLDLESIEEDRENPTADYGRIVGEEFTRTMRKWEEYEYEIPFRLREMLSFGLAPSFWEDETTWKSKAVKIANCLFSLKKKAKIGGIGAVFLRDEIEVKDLFEKIEDKEAAKDEGWNVAYTRDIIVKTFMGEISNDDEDYQGSVWESVQQKIKNLDYDDDRQFDGVRIVHVLSEEADGGEVTHYIIAENDDNDDPEFLFKHDRRYDKMSSALHIWMHDFGDGFFKAIRGLAHEIYSTNEISNRYLNDLLDGSKIASGLVLQGSTGDDSQQMPIIKKGPVTIINDNLNAIQSTFAPPIQHLVEVRNLIGQVQKNIAGIYKQQGENLPGQDARSATEARLEQQNEASLQNDQAAWYYSQWQGWLTETFRRMINPDYDEDTDGYEEAKDFRERCIRRGVPKSFMKFDNWDVHVNVAIGLGNPSEKLRLTNWLLNISSMLDEQGRKNALFDAVGVRFGYRKARRYVSLANRDQIESQEHSIARIENNQLRQGLEVLAGSDQAQTIHLTMHFKELLVPLAQGFMQGQVKLEQAVPTMIAGLKHTADHINNLRQDKSRKGAVREFEKLQNQLTGIAKQMQAQLEKLIKQRQKQAEANAQLLEEAKEQKKSEEFELEMEKVRSKERVEMANVESLNNKRMLALQNDIQVTIQKAMADLSRKQRESEAKIETMLRESEAKKATSQ